MNINYLAGYFDGEGCISMSRYQNYNLCCRVASVNPAIPLLFRDAFEGWICYYKGRKEGHRDQVVWSISGKKVTSFLKRILPYLIIKKEEALIGVEYREKHLEGGHRKKLTLKVLADRERYAQRLSALKRIKY